ncbi:hypothetical protein V2J09_003785 [Rumex salicifolius]
MEELSSPRCTFSVGLKPAHQLLRCLILMTGVTSTAVLIVKDGKIQLLACSPDDNTHASVEMEALTAASWDSGWFAIHFDLSVWIELLRPSISQQETESLWIYKIGVFPDLSCLVGNNEIPIRLGDAQFVQEKGVDMKYLGRLASHPVKIHMRTQCLREVILAFAPKYVHVGLMVMNDRVTWHTIAGEFTYHAKALRKEQLTICWFGGAVQRCCILLQPSVKRFPCAA